MRPASAVLCLALFACSGAETPLLSERRSYVGDIEITVRRGGVEHRAAGDLRFDRAAKNLQFTRRGERTVVLLRMADGQVARFVDNRKADADDADRRMLEAVESAANHVPSATATIERGDNRYRIEDGDLVLEVELKPGEMTKVHGH